MARLEFFFDCSSPWTYLAFHRIQDVIRETGADVVWRPILVGGVFNAVNQDVYTERAKVGDRLSEGASVGRRPEGHLLLQGPEGLGRVHRPGDSATRRSSPSTA